MSQIILDSSALLASLQQEPGCEIIKPLLKNAIMSTVNLAEVLTVLQRIHIKSHEALEDIRIIIKNILPFTLEHANIAADLDKQTKKRGLSLGDRACLSLGINLRLPIYTADKIWKDLSIADLDIKLIR